VSWATLRFHRVIRRGFEQAREYVLAPGAESRAGAVAEYIGFQFDGLHAHHSSEDELLWPILLDEPSFPAR
jgi:Hemerythrin HHE cation binding domain